MPANPPYFVIEPYRDGPDRYQHATVISEHATAAEAFDALAELTARVHHFGMSADQFEWLVVDADRRPVRGH